MQLIKPDININFIGKSKIAFYISVSMILVSIASLIIHKGPRYGIDFAGGTLIQIKFSNPVNIDDIKSGLTTIDLEKSSVQQFGDKQDNEYLVRTERAGIAEQGFSFDVQKALESSTGTAVEVRRVEMVGPQVGKDLREKALFAMFYALLFITIYISWRFELKLMISGVMAGALMGAVYSLSFFDVSIPFLIAAALIVTLLLFWFLGLRPQV